MDLISLVLMEVFIMWEFLRFSIRNIRYSFLFRMEIIAWVENIRVFVFFLGCDIFINMYFIMNVLIMDFNIDWIKRRIIFFGYLFVMIR